MISKNSFLVSLKENNKRRLWVWVLSILTFMLLIPIQTALNINQVMNWSEIYFRDYGAMAEKMLHSELMSTVKGTLGTSVLLLLCTCATAVVSAVQGFSWLSSRKKIDFSLGMPVKRNKRFLVIWLNGIFLYVIPYLSGLLISILIAAGNKAANAQVIEVALQAFGLHFGVYIGLYHLAILAVMLTGNIVVTGLGLAVLCGYEYLVRMVDYGYRCLFFKYFSYYGYREFPVLSPIGIYTELADSNGYGVKADAGWIIGLIVFGIGTGLLAYFCYLKRPAEAAGKAMTFELTKPVIKILLVVPIALMLGLIVSDSIGFDPFKNMDGIGYLIVAIGLGIVIGCCAIQVIYEFDIKGALHKKRHIVLSGVLTAFIFMLYRYDLTGFDSYVPDAGKVESAAFIPSGYDTVGGDRSYYSYLDSGFAYTSAEDYSEKHMILTNVADVCELAECSIAEYDKIDTYSDEYLEESGSWPYATVIYRLKNGNKVYRQLWVNVEDEKTCELLDRIIGSKEFKNGYFMACSEEFDQFLESNSQYTVKATYGNLVYQKKMSKSDLRELLEAYRKDAEMTNFTQIKENIPIGAVKIEVEQQASEGYPGSSTYIGEYGINIYPVYANCISYLKEHGYYMEKQLELEDVIQIQVINQNSEAYEKLWDKQLTSAGADTILQDADNTQLGLYSSDYSDINTRVQMDYTQREEIEEIISNIYPQDLIFWRWDNGTHLEYDYEVRVYLKSESDVGKDYDLWASYGFVEGKVPEFVIHDTAFKE